MEWKEVRLGDVCEIKHGFAYKGKYFSDTPTCDILVTPGNFTLSGGFKLDKPKFYNGPVEKDYILSKGDLIVTMTDLSKNIDTLGYSALVPEVKGLTFHHNQRIGLVENIANNVDKYFLYWIMRTPAYQSFIATHSSGTTVHHTSPKGIGNYVFKLPPLDDQRRIASILSSLDRKIELNNKINADLEEMAQAIFKNWFVDFEPFKDGKFVDSELGMIPEGWKVGRLDEIADVVGGSTPSKAKPEYYTQKGIAWLTPKDLSNHPAVYTSRGVIDITEEGYNSTSTKLMPKGTILFTSRAPIGYISIAQNDICTNQGFKSLVPKKAGTCFLYCFLKYVTPEIENKSTGSTFKEASGSLMKSLQVIMPEQKVFEDFETIVSPLFARIESLEKENSRLSLLRDTLLPRLMSGELEVPE
ncbi:restriction endonuclease subunit S [Segatella sp.]|jgi:type I restriction enzyme S subunit|uniref:restriction endonuclease subunit S n=1 Tax=Segatella sp. TaxID=2974253 RepID=UPI003AAF5770